MSRRGRAPAPRRRANLGMQRRGGFSARRHRPWYRLGWRRWIKIGAAGVAVGASILGCMVAYAALTLPNLSDIGERTGTIKIYADDNTTLLAELGHDSRPVQTVAIAQIALDLQHATVAAEDKSFYNEGAFDLSRVAKALFVDVIARQPSEGASTITQQLAKQAFFVTDTQTADKSPLRKLREALLANEIDQTYTKDQILEKYLNLIYYGENAYGIESASQRYFGKSAAQLTLQEASLLAGLPQLPSELDPFNNPTGAYARQHYVLGQMVADGYVTQAQADAVDPMVGGDDPTAAQAAAQRQNQMAIHNDLNNGKKDSVGIAPHFAQYILNQLTDTLGQSDPTLTSGNLSVYTTLNVADQTKAQAAVTSGVKAIGHGANNGALLMLDSHTGAIKAMVGSADYNDDAIAGQFNVVTAERRPGSSFKPYVYETGFRTGALKPTTVLQDTSAESKKLGGVKDFDDAFLGPISAARALVLSRDVPAEQAWLLTGGSNIIDFVHGLGITSDIQDNASSALGSSSVRMIEQTAAYAAFSNGGNKVTAWGITKVIDTDLGTSIHPELFGAQQEGSVMSPADAYLITKILRGYAEQWGERFNVPTAGKSGTTDNFVDAWYMTYTPDVVIGTWAGHTDGGNPAEIPMDGVYGTTEGMDVAVPFVNSLHLPYQEFTPVAETASTCDPADEALGAAGTEGCPTATPLPTLPPAPQPTVTPLPAPTLSPSPAPSPLPSPSTPLQTLPPTPSTALFKPFAPTLRPTPAITGGPP